MNSKTLQTLFQLNQKLSTQIRWCIYGGVAAEIHAGMSIEEHKDIDIIIDNDKNEIKALLHDEDLHFFERSSRERGEFILNSQKIELILMRDWNTIDTPEGVFRFNRIEHINVEGHILPVVDYEACLDSMVRFLRSLDKPKKWPEGICPEQLRTKLAKHIADLKRAKVDVVHFVDTAFEITDTHIVSEINSISRYRPILLFNERIEEDRFNLQFPLVCTNARDFWPSKTQYPPNAPALNNFVKSLINVIQESAPNAEILHAQFSNEAIRLVDVTMKLNIKLIVNCRGSDTLEGVIREPEGYRKLFDVTKLFLVRSESMKDQLERAGCPVRKIAVHHSGVRTDAFTFRKVIYPENKEFRLVTIARLVPKKGIDDSLRAFKEFQEGYPKSRYIIVGFGEELSSLQDLTNNLGIGRFVEFITDTSREAVMEQLGRAHLFVLTSKTVNHKQEGIPNVLSEALLSGLPCISTNHSAIPELLNECGFLADEGNVDDIVSKMIMAAENEGLASRMVQVGRERIKKNFNAITQSKRLEAIYDEIRGVE